MNAKKVFVWILRIIVLTVLYLPIWILGSIAVADRIADAPSEPGLVDPGAGMMFLSVINTLLIVGLIVSSRWSGWRLALLLALGYYGSFTLMTQLETWYFLSATVPPELLVGLFIMGLPVPFIFIPLAVWICGRWKPEATNLERKNINLPGRQWMLRLGILAIAYVVIYWCAGYFIAWQNPELRTFYGSPGPITPFWTHTFNTLRDSPGLFALQLVRGPLFVLVALPLLFGSNVSAWLTALLVGLLLAVPHLAHILPNPLMPNASVRSSHMIETATSTFLFGLMIVWVLHHRHGGAPLKP